MIIAVGYRVKSQMATRFRQWATTHLHEFIQKGFTLDDNRLKGTISHEEAKQKAVAEFEEYRRREMLQYENDYDWVIRELIDKEKK